MDFEQLMCVRESCRAYQDKPVKRELLEKLVDTARMSPSGCNAQPWHFIIVDEKNAREKLIEAFDDNGLTGCPWGYQVPAFIVICEEYANVQPLVKERYGSQRFAQMDIGMAAMILCLEASEIGLSTCMIGTMNQEKMREALQIPEDKPVRLIITVGYAAKEGEPRAKVRKPLEDILTYNHW